MARKIGGLDELEYRNAIQLLAHTKSPGDIQRLIESDPVFSNPTLHRLWIAKLQDELAPLRDRIEVFFRFQALRVHRAFFDTVPRLEAKEQGPSANRHGYLPLFYAALMDLLGNGVPQHRDWTLNPARDIERLEVEISEALGRRVVLPAYASLEGSLWNAIVVLCAGCRRLRVDVRAYYIDLVTAPELQRPLAEGVLNCPRCPYCREAVAFPSRIWVSEEPFAPDTLHGMGCIWRSATDALVFRPPAGTRRLTENDQIMMYRATEMVGSFRWPALGGKSGKRSVRVNITIAYSDGDLRRLLLSDESAKGAIPRAMKALWDYTAADMRSGQYPFHAAKARVIEEVQADYSAAEWPIGGMTPIEEMEGFRRLALCLIREAVAERAGRSSAERAFFAGETCDAYRRLGQLGLARAALAQSELHLAESEHGPERDLAELTLRFQRGELAAAAGDTAESSRLFDEMLRTVRPGATDLTSRCAKLNLTSLHALELKQQERYVEAIPQFLENIGGWTELGNEVATVVTPEARQLMSEIQRSLSADLANLGGSYQDLMRYLRAERILTEAVQGKKPSPSDSLFLKLDGPLPAHAFQVLNDDLLAILEKLFPPGPSERKLFLAATELLERALSLSTATDYWNFVAIQGHRLAHLYLQGGDRTAAARVMQSAMAAAARISDYDRLVAGHLFLTEMTLNEGDGTAGLRHLREATRQHLRQLISSGHQAHADVKTLALIRLFAHRALDRGGDAVEAALIVEALKSVTTASSMITGRPDQARADVSKHQESPAAAKLSQREELRLRSIWQTDAKDQIEKQIEMLDAEIARDSANASLLDGRFASWVSAVEFDLADVDSFCKRLERLGQQTTFLGACPLGNQLWVYAIWPGGSVKAVVEMPNPDVLSDEWTDDDADRLAQVAKLVLRPVDERLRALQPEDVLVISPADEFTGLAFSALPFRGGVLCQHVKLCFVHGVAILEACLDRPRLSYRSILLLGAPFRPELPDLPGALKEANTISGLFKSHDLIADCLNGEDATTSALSESSADRDIVHVACHAERTGSTEGRLALMLTPDLRRKDSGVLTEDRLLAEVALQAGALVNLAGCATGLQQDSGAALMSGLVPVFLIAGAGCVMASLWPIEDGPAAEFQRHFYSELLTHHDPLKSLALTQRRCLSGALGEKMRSARVWAAFQLFGSGGGISGEQ